MISIVIVYTLSLYIHSRSFQKFIKTEESELKKQVIQLNEQFQDLMVQASLCYPEILNEDFAKRSAKFTRKPKHLPTIHSSQILTVNPDNQQIVENSETMKRSPSLPLVKSTPCNDKQIMRQYSAEIPSACDSVKGNPAQRSANRNGVCRSPAFRHRLNRNRRSFDELSSREDSKGCEGRNFHEQSERSATDNDRKKALSTSNLEHDASTTESSDSSTASAASQSSYSPENMDEERKKKLKRKLKESRKNLDVVNLGMF